MRERLRRSSFARTLRGLPYRVGYAAFRLVVPVRANRVLFLSDSHKGFAGNMRLVRDELERTRPDAELIGVFKPSLRARRSIRDMLRLPCLMATSAAIVLDDFYPLVYGIRLRPATRLIQLWHAAGAFKRVGHSRGGLPGGPPPGSETHRNYTDAYVSSESIRDDYAEAYGIGRERVRALGLPRSDFFFSADAVAAARARIRDDYGMTGAERLVVFAPTFRGDGQLSAYSDESADWGRIARELGADWRIAVRRHPFTEATSPPLPAGILDGGGDREMSDLLAAADVLVTDYSSAVFEYALLRRPVVFFAPDLEAYTAERSFYRPFDRYAIGPVVRRESEVAEAIAAATVDADRHDAFLAEFCDALDGRSTERIARDILPPAALREVRESTRRRITRMLQLDVAAAHLARLAVGIVSGALGVLPRRRKVTMLTREHSRTPLDFVLLRDAIERLDPAVEVVTIARMVPPGVFAKIAYALHLLTELFHVATSRVLIVDGYSIVASAARHDEGLTIVQMWHALGALKKFGLSILGRPEGRDPRLAKAMRMHRNYDMVLTSAERCRAPFAEAFGIDIDKVVVAPLPRVDRLRDPQARRRARERFAKLYPELRDHPIALYAPTFRANAALPVDPVELTEALSAEGFATVTKLHPIVQPPTHAGLRTAPGMSTQDLLLVADVFVTDYSSAIFEAAVAGVPSYLLAPDLDRYQSSRDFYLDYARDLDLPICTSVEGLSRVLDPSPASADRIRALGARFVEVAPDHEPTDASDRLAALLLAVLDGHPPESDKPDGVRRLRRGKRIGRAARAELASTSRSRA